MYVVNRRLLERFSLSARFRWAQYYQGNYRDIRINQPTIVEGVYSWRTGQRAVSDPPVVPSDSKVDPFGLNLPSGKGNLVTQLAERKKYVEELQRAAFPAETQSGSVSTDRTSTTDSGHLFVSHKTFRNPYIGTLDYGHPSVWDEYKGHTWGTVGEGVQNNSPFPLGLPGENAANGLGLTETQRQGVANHYFAMTAPDRNDASLAVTAIELLRGDIPSLLKNFQSMMAGYKSVRNYLGSDYLNIVFGWTPLIQEYANVIKVGMGLDRAIYYESLRRKRQWDGPSMRGSLPTTTTLSTLGAPYDVAGLAPGDQAGINFGLVLNYPQEGRWVESEDYHLTSRYGGLAKPTLRANAFNDQALDVIKRLGLIEDPRLLWDLTPWSWLVDWFTTMGDSLSNAAVYSPVRGKYNIDYAYMTTKRSRSADGYIVSTIPTNPGDFMRKSTSVVQRKSFAYSTTKWRDRATPFGFGTQLGSLSASQYAILVALGLAKRR